MYEEFVKDFGDAGDFDDPAKKAFVRGGVIQTGQAPAPFSDADGGGDSGTKKRKYVPPVAPRPVAKVAAEFAEDEDDDEEAEDEVNYLEKMDCLLLLIEKLN